MATEPVSLNRRNTGLFIEHGRWTSATDCCSLSPSEQKKWGVGILGSPCLSVRILAKQYLLNCSILCDQTWYGGASSWVRVLWVCCPQGQGHNKGLCNQSRTIVSSELWKWSWHHHQRAAAILKTRQLNMYSRDACFCRKQDKMYGQQESSYTPNSKAEGRNWRRWPHSSCRLDFQCSGDWEEEDKFCNQTWYGGTSPRLS